MSSWICSPKHFNSIEKKLIELFDANSQKYFSLPYNLRDLYPALYNRRNSFHKELVQPIENHIKEITDTIDELRTLNVLCVKMQYAHHSQGTLDNEILEETKYLLDNKKENKKLTDLGLLNALRCLFYQIEIEHLQSLRQLTDSERKVVKFLRTMINQMALHICNELPDDKTCTWSIE